VATAPRITNAPADSPSETSPVDDPSKALQELLDRKRALDEAQRRVDELRRFRMAATSSGRVLQLEDPFQPEQGVVRCKDGSTFPAAGMLPQFYSAKHIEEDARERYELALVTYREAVRRADARDAAIIAKSNVDLAVANKNVSARIAWLTLVLALTAVAQTIATIVQLVHTWRK
jgi:hypothetical protein